MNLRKDQKDCWKKGTVGSLAALCMNQVIGLATKVKRDGGGVDSFKGRRSDESRFDSG